MKSSKWKSLPTNKERHFLLVPLTFIYLIIGIVFASISGGKLSDTVLYVIFFAVSIVVNGLFAFVTGKKLYDNIDEYFERAEA